MQILVIDLSKCEQDCEIMNELDIQGQLYSIVVVGTMNPLIHHPTWYKNQGLITPEQEQEILKSGKMVCLPQISQMDSSGFGIACEQERWMARIRDESNLGTLLNIATKVFDGALLTHTPVRAFGINADFDVKTSKSVGKALSRLSVTFGIDIPEGLEANGLFQSSWSTEYGENKVTIKPSIFGPDVVLVENNFHFGAPKESFDLGALIEANFNQCIEKAKETTKQVVTSISKGAQ